MAPNRELMLATSLRTQPEQPMMVAGGASPQTERIMNSDPDLDKGLRYTPPAVTTQPQARKSTKYYTPAGKTPDEQAEDRRKMEENYQKYKTRRG